MTTLKNTPEPVLVRLLRNDLMCRGLTISTIDEYCHQIRPLFDSHADVEAMVRDEIVAWINERDTQSKRRFRWLAVKALFRMLHEEGLIASNPCDKVKMPKEQTRPQPYLSDENYAALTASCDTSFQGRRDLALLTVLNSTGCRRGELVALRVGDVDLDKGVVLIRHAKSGSGRYAYLDGTSIRAILHWLRHRTLGNQVEVSPTAALWTTEQDAPLTANAVRLMLQRRSRRLGFHASPHQFRRRFAVNWHLRGGSPLGLMTAAGWSSPTMPARYAAEAASEIAREEHRRMFD